MPVRNPAIPLHTLPTPQCEASIYAQALSAVGAFSFWLVAVMSVGLARLGSVPFLRAAWLVFAYWVLQESFFNMLGLGQLAYS